jgi:rRNA processing protein Krr1/Pno1
MFVMTVCGALGAIAGGTIYKYGVAGQYSEDPKIAGLTGCVVFLIVVAVTSLLGLGASTGSEKSDKKKKKKNKNSKKAVTGTESKPQENQPKAKETKAQESKPKVGTKGKDAKPEPSKPKSKKSEPKPDAKEEPKSKAPKAKKSAPKPAAKVTKSSTLDHEAKHDDSDSEDYDLARLIPSKKTDTRGPAVAQSFDDSSEDEDFSLPTAGGSKSQLRRRKEKAKKAAFESDAAFEKSQTPQVDPEGFESVIVKRRQKKAVVAAVVAVDGMGAESLNNEDVPCEAKHFGMLIGPGGATLKKFQEACNVRINIPDRESDKKSINIAGEPADIAKCKSNILHLITKGYCAITDPNTQSTTVSVQPKQLGTLIGPGGKNIKALQEKLGVKINTPDRASESSKVTISGEKAAVKACKEAIHSLLEYGFSVHTHPGWVATEVEFPAEEFGTLIGPGGNTIKSIQGDTKTKVNIPDAKNPNQNVVVVGEAAGVAAAVKQISQLLARRAAKAEAAEEAEALRFNDPDYDSDDDKY